MIGFGKVIQQVFAKVLRQVFLRQEFAHLKLCGLSRPREEVAAKLERSELAPENQADCLEQVVRVFQSLTPDSQRCSRRSRFGGEPTVP